MLETRRDLLLK